MTAYLMTPEQHAQIVDALEENHRIKEQHEALAMLKAMKPQEPVAWYERNADMNAWFLAYGHNPKADTKPLYTLGDTA